MTGRWCSADTQKVVCVCAQNKAVKETCKLLAFENLTAQRCNYQRLNTSSSNDAEHCSTISKFTRQTPTI